MTRSAPAALALWAVVCMVCPAAPAGPPGDASQIESIPNLVGLWTFGEQAGQARLSQGTAQTHALTEVGVAVQRLDAGPFGGAAYLNGSNYFHIPYLETGDLNISGTAAQVSMVAFVKLQDLTKVSVAGMWYEGSGAYDDSGSRQYALLLDMPTYGGAGQVTPHISSEGGVTRRADGSMLPWCADYAASASKVQGNVWVSVGFTYDSQYIKAYYNGVFEPRDLNPAADGRTDSYFTTEGPDGGDRGMNPYYHGRGIFTYDPALHSITKPQGGADFTVGARFAVGAVSELMQGAIGGLAVFDRALSDAEMLQIHAAGALDVLNAPPPDQHLAVDFENTVGPGNVSLNDYNANTGQHWQTLFGPGGTVGGANSDGAGVRVASSTLAGIGYYLAGLPGTGSSIALAWTDDADAVDASAVRQISGRLNNKSTSDKVRFAVRIDGQWYASDQAFAISPAGVAYNNWANAQEVALDFTPDAAGWRMLTAQPGSALALGGLSDHDLSGQIDAFGVFVEIHSAGLVRLDDFTVQVPEPVTLTLLAAAVPLVVSRRRGRARGSRWKGRTQGLAS